MMLGLTILLCLFSTVFGDDQPINASLPLTDSLGIQSTSSGFLINPMSGEKYHLSELYPHRELFSPRGFVVENSSGRVIDQRTQKVIQIPLYKAVFSDGAVMLAEMDTHGSFLCAELRVEGCPTVYFVRTGDCKPNELVAFVNDQVSEATMESLSFGHIALPFPRVQHPLSVHRNESLELPDFFYTPGDRSSAECVYFKVVNIGVVFDTEFCRKYGGKTEARSRIMMIVAAASLIYEDEMCVRLRLVDIYTPDEDCESLSAFDSMPRDKACGAGIDSETFIRHFRDWMNSNRDAIGLFPDAVYHAFTGFPPRGTLGCAYIGVFCTEPEFAYGVNYMSSDLLSTQSIIFAHELGHNLNAKHVSSNDAGGSRYIMAPSVQNPNDGFSQATIKDILGWLDSDIVVCDEIAFPDASSPPSISPTIKATERPSVEIRGPIPTATPSTEPSQTPSTCTCRLELVSEGDPSICFTESSGGLFGCLERERLRSIIRPNSCCEKAESSVDFSVLACQEVEEDDVSNDDISNDDISNNGKNHRPWNQREKTTESLNHPYHQQYSDAGMDPESNDRGLEIFYANDCSVIDCAVFDEFVCVNAQLNAWERQVTYRLELSATLGGLVESFTVDVVVNRDPADRQEDETCHAAETMCVHG